MAAMSVGDVLSLGSALVTLASKIQTLVQDWYTVPDEYRSKIGILRIKLESWDTQLNKYGVALDSNLVKALREAESLLEKEEANLMEPGKEGREKRVGNRAKAKMILFPRILERIIQNVIDEIEKIPTCLKMEAENALLLQQHVKSRPILTTIRSDVGNEFYVPIEWSHFAVIKALDDVECPSIVLLHGGPGKGKSTLAKCVQKHYGERGRGDKFKHTVWLTCGDKADSLVKQIELLQILDPSNAQTLPSLQEGQRPESGLESTVKQQLEHLLLLPKILIILDDVWDGKFLYKMWNLGGKRVKYLVTSQKGNLCSTLPTAPFSIPMKNPTQSEARSILAAHIGLKGNKIPPGKLETITDQLINKIDANPAALASFATYFAYKDYREKTDETEWSIANSELSSSLHSTENRKFVLGQTEIESLWVTMGRSVEIIEAMPEARNILLLMYMCQGSSVLEQVLQILCKGAKDVQKGYIASFFKARGELSMKELLKVDTGSIYFDLPPRRTWSLHSLVKFYIQENLKQTEVESMMDSVLAFVGTGIDPIESEIQLHNEKEEVESEKAKVMIALCALYFDHDHHDHIIRDFADRAAIKMQIPFDDRTKFNRRRRAVEPLIRLLGELDVAALPDKSEWTKDASRCARQVFLKYICEGQLDESGICSLLTFVNSPSTILALLRALQNICRTEENPLMNEDIGSVWHALSGLSRGLSKEGVEGYIQETAIRTLDTVTRKANGDNVKFPTLNPSTMSVEIQTLPLGASSPSKDASSCLVAVSEQPGSPRTPARGRLAGAQRAQSPSQVVGNSQGLEGEGRQVGLSSLGKRRSRVSNDGCPSEDCAPNLASTVCPSSVNSRLTGNAYLTPQVGARDACSSMHDASSSGEGVLFRPSSKKRKLSPKTLFRRW